MQPAPRHSCRHYPISTHACKPVRDSGREARARAFRNKKGAAFPCPLLTALLLPGFVSLVLNPGFAVTPAPDFAASRASITFCHGQTSVDCRVMYVQAGRHCKSTTGGCTPGRNTPARPAFRGRAIYPRNRPCLLRFISANDLTIACTVHIAQPVESRPRPDIRTRSLNRSSPPFALDTPLGPGLFLLPPRASVHCDHRGHRANLIAKTIGAG